MFLRLHPKWKENSDLNAGDNCIPSANELFLLKVECLLYSCMHVVLSTLHHAVYIIYYYYHIFFPSTQNGFF